ncbi:general secretion pathway protein GspK [Methylobacterium sp. Leaf122]|nr:type II secretion system protein GspK [Methylobacterium sp. Leaf122]KQQ18820.1 general secretion pathway protein GspK [Methylobacterium sp. Leaf122]
MRPHRSVASGEQGFVLPAVLAVMIVVSAAALIATDRHRTRTAVAESQTRGLRLQGLADGAARLVATGIVLERTRGMPGLGLPRNGAAIACGLPEGRRLVLALQDQAGLIDLNAAPRPPLEAAFRALSIGDADALRLAAEVMDYRDADDDPEPGGAERPQYAARGLSHGPRNALFTSIDEIERLPSMTPERAALLRGALTIYNPGGGLDPGLAPVRALAEGVAGDRLRPHVALSSGQYVEIRAAVLDGRGRALRSAIISASGTGTSVLSWQPDGPDLVGGVAHPACAPLAAALIRL